MFHVKQLFSDTKSAEKRVEHFLGRLAANKSIERAARGPKMFSGKQEIIVHSHGGEALGRRQGPIPLTTIESQSVHGGQSGAASLDQKRRQSLDPGTGYR
tara:strand:- start:81 stop:380 length:300 start_codon:yes stop_codon:yes gene_type:complete